MRFYVYVLKIGYQPFYVGVTSDISRRFAQHKKDKKNLDKYKFIQQNIANVEIEVVKECDDRESVLLWEEFYIREFKHYGLFNVQKKTTKEEKVKQAILNAKQIIKNLKTK